MKESGERGAWEDETFFLGLERDTEALFASGLTGYGGCFFFPNTLPLPMRQHTGRTVHTRNSTATARTFIICRPTPRCCLTAPTPTYFHSLHLFECTDTCPGARGCYRVL